MTGISGLQWVQTLDIMPEEGGNVSGETTALPQVSNSVDARQLSRERSLLRLRLKPPLVKTCGKACALGYREVLGESSRMRGGLARGILTFHVAQKVGAGHMLYAFELRQAKTGRFRVKSIWRNP